MAVLPEWGVDLSPLEPSRRTTKRYNYDLADTSLDAVAQARAKLKVGPRVCVCVCVCVYMCAFAGEGEGEEEEEEEEEERNAALVVFGEVACAYGLGNDARRAFLWSELDLGYDLSPAV